MPKCPACRAELGFLALGRKFEDVGTGSLDVWGVGFIVKRI